MNCKICTKLYNFSSNKPYICIPCGHTFCISCLIENANACFVCQNDIQKFKPNFSILDILETSQNVMPTLSEASSTTESKINNIESKLKVNNLNNEKIIDENALYRSPNHKHSFRMVNSPVSYCQGNRLFGNCKSNWDKDTSSVNYFHFECTDCYSFNFCENCFKTPKKLKDEYLYCRNHNHRFNRSTNTNWFCDGKSIYGKCLSDQKDTFELDRFKCADCPDYDLCKYCLNAPRLEKYKCKNHKHEFKKWLVNGSEEEEEKFCQGNWLFEECKSKNMPEKNLFYYKCLKCYDYFMCEACFNQPEVPKYHSPNHEHPFKRFYRLTGWRCDGNRVFIKCKANLGHSADGHARYRCTICYDFDFCEACLKEPKVETFSCPNHGHALIERSISDANESVSCYGYYLFGKCKKEKNENLEISSKIYGCRSCEFDICSKCLNEPKLAEHETVNHAHKFEKFYHLEKYCQGHHLFGMCLLGSNMPRCQDEIYKCKECDLYLCAVCFNAPDKNNSNELQNYLTLDLTGLFNENDS